MIPCSVEVCIRLYGNYIEGDSQLKTDGAIIESTIFELESLLFNFSSLNIKICIP
jgi:hypothetical protein